MTVGFAIGTPLNPAPIIGPGSAAGSRLKFLTYNAHLFAGAGVARDSQSGSVYHTGFIFEDEERAELIPQCIRALQADVVGLTEAWHPQVRQQIITSLQDIYPYHYSSKGLEGISEIFRSLESRWPRTTAAVKYLLPRTPQIVDGLSSLHYNSGECGMLASALQCFRGLVAEDTVYRSLKWFINPDAQWHAFDDALLLLSRYPIKNAVISSYQARADHEHFVRKGILKAEIHPPHRAPVTVLLTHNQEGESLHARRARHTQLGKLRQLVQQSSYPVVVMGDLNERREEWLTEQLNLIDSYRQLFPDRRAFPGYTYSAETPYAKQQGIRGGHNSQLRLDYVFTNSGLRVRTSQIRRDEFRHPQKEYDLSDHFPVEAEVEVA